MKKGPSPQRRTAMRITSILALRLGLAGLDSGEHGGRSEVVALFETGPDTVHGLAHAVEGGTGTIERSPIVCAVAAVLAVRVVGCGCLGHGGGVDGAAVVVGGDGRAKRVAWFVHL